MNIKELYLKYAELKGNNIPLEELAWELNKYNICLKDSKKDTLNKWILEDYINSRPAEYTDENIIKYKRTKENFKIDENSKFLSVHHMSKKANEKNYIKFYLSVPDDIKEKFMIEYANYIKENKISSAYKIRKNKQSNDLITVRVYDPKNYKNVFEFLKQYVNKDIQQHELMPK